MKSDFVMPGPRKNKQLCDTDEALSGLGSIKKYWDDINSVEKKKTNYGAEYC